MIFARDKSQMCNNLLQYAHVYAWGREHGQKVISMRFSYKYRYFHICHTSLTNFGWYLFAKYMAALHLLPTISFKEDTCDVQALEQQMLRRRHFVVSGWHARFYDLFLKYRQEICELFTIDEEYTMPVKEKMKSWDGIRLGVHIRRGDYANFYGGRFLYTDEQYLSVIRSFMKLHPSDNIVVYICSNDPILNHNYYRSCLEGCKVVFPDGNPGEDICLLSHCHYLMGAPSTFTLVASMYNDLPLYWIEDPTLPVNEKSFKRFDYLFQHIY